MLERGRSSGNVSRIAQLHTLTAEHAEQPPEVIGGIESDRGRLPNPQGAAGDRVDGSNPRAASSYRDRHTTQSAKSDASDAKLRADRVRTDAHNHRPLDRDADEASATREPARAHQDLVRRRHPQANGRRSALRDYFPAARAQAIRHRTWPCAEVDPGRASPSPGIQAPPRVSTGCAALAPRPPSAPSPRGGPAGRNACEPAPKLGRMMPVGCTCAREQRSRRADAAAG